VLAHVLLAVLHGALLRETSARWSCEPDAVRVGEPFMLVLELEHDAGLGLRALLPRDLTLDESWVVLDSAPLASASLPGGRARTRAAWHVASLEPGERSLAEPLAGVALGEGVARIQVGDARVQVLGLLAEGEDVPRPLRGFPEGFAGATSGSGGGLSRALVAAGLGLGVLVGVAYALWQRRRAQLGAAPAPSPLERLRALEAEAAERSRERCYELTRLLRQAGDELTRKPRGALTDEEWLAAVRTSLEIPRGIVDELALVFERAARVKYAGEVPTDWALQETFAKARGALEALRGSGAP
jgi:hypothetical protein